MIFIKLWNRKINDEAFVILVNFEYRLGEKQQPIFFWRETDDTENPVKTKRQTNRRNKKNSLIIWNWWWKETRARVNDTFSFRCCCWDVRYMFNGFLFVHRDFRIKFTPWNVYWMWWKGVEIHWKYAEDSVLCCDFSFSVAFRRENNTQTHTHL